jgi:hypothetical protein
MLALLLASYGGLNFADDEPSLEDALREGRALATEVGDELAVAMACRGLAAVAVGRGDFDAAIQLYQEDLLRCRRLGDTMGVSGTLVRLGRVRLTSGDRVRARTDLIEALRPMGDPHFRANPATVFALEALAACFAVGEPARAAVLLGASEALRTRHWTRAGAPPVDDGKLHDELRERLAPNAFAEAWDRGMRLGPEEAVEVALEGSPARDER